MSDKPVPVRPHARNKPKSRKQNEPLDPQYAKPQSSSQQITDGVKIVGGSPVKPFERPDTGVQIVRR